MIQLKLLLILFLFHVYPVFSQDKLQVANDQAKEFAESKFIQVDPLSIPKELSSIDKQITQNAIDVIILISGHTVIYSQKLEEEYTEKYKQFFGLSISIFPIANQPDYFSLKLKYYNWTTTRFDKGLTKKISKYNVLNELRFALYGLFKGKKYVEKNQEKIELENYERITSIRNNFEEDKARRLKEQKIDTQRANQLASETQKQETERLKREKKELLEKVNQSSKTPYHETESNSKGQATEEVNSIVDSSPETATISPSRQSQKDNNKKNEKKSPHQQPNIIPHDEEKKINDNNVTNYPSASRFSLLIGLNSQKTKTQKIISASTNPLYLNAGFDYLYKFGIKWPLANNTCLLLGYPIKKDNYSFSTTPFFSTDIGFFRLFKFLSFGPGLSYQTLSFVNLPNRGEDLQLINNTILAYYLYFHFDFMIKDFKQRLSLSSTTSFFSKNTFNQKINTTSKNFSWNLTKNQHGIKLSFSKGIISGQYSGNFSSTSLHYTYNFPSTL